jgi:hypothetical protein
MKAMQNNISTAANKQRPVSTCGSCKICTIHLEQLCYARAWWFRVFREILATGIRCFAFFYGIRADQYTMRSSMCKKCLRFRKNILKEKSGVFNWMDGYLNPMFNRVRDSLLSEQEKENARRLAVLSGDSSFTMQSKT